MGWETDLVCSISFNRKTYNSKYEVEEDLKEAEACVELAKKDLHSLAYMTEPNKFCGESTPEEYVEEKITSAIYTLIESTREVYKLELLLDNWKACHNEKNEAISLYGKILNEEETKKLWLGRLAFLDGDFVKTDVKEENND